jgi:hypothetical protein
MKCDSPVIAELAACDAEVAAARAEGWRAAAETAYRLALAAGADADREVMKMAARAVRAAAACCADALRAVEHAWSAAREAAAYARDDDRAADARREACSAVAWAIEAADTAYAAFVGAEVAAERYVGDHDALAAACGQAAAAARERAERDFREQRSSRQLST